MDISVRYLHNYIIETFYNIVLASVVYYVTHKVLISDTPLSSFIPQQVCKMTPKLRQICGCEICIILKDMKVNLNIYITIIVTDL